MLILNRSIKRTEATDFCLLKYPIYNITFTILQECLILQYNIQLCDCNIKFFYGQVQAVTALG